MNTRRRNRTAQPIVILLLLIVIGTTTGCLWAPNLSAVREDIERQMPGVHFDKQIELTLGRVSLLFARLITAFVPDARDASRYLRDVNRIELAVYDTDGTSTKQVSMPDRLSTMQKQEGWELAIKVHENDDHVWVLYRADGEKIKEVFVVVMGDGDLVMVKAQGRLERLIAYALTESGAMKHLPRSEHSL